MDYKLSQGTLAKLFLYEKDSYIVLYEPRILETHTLPTPVMLPYAIIIEIIDMITNSRSVTQLEAASVGGKPCYRNEGDDFHWDQEH